MPFVAIAGKDRFPVDQHPDGQCAADKRRRRFRESKPLPLKIGAIDEQFAVEIAFVIIPPAGDHRIDRTGRPIDRRERFVDMQFPRQTVEAHPVPVEQPERRITGLLDFGHQHAAADGVHRAGGNKETIARLRNE